MSRSPFSSWPGLYIMIHCFKSLNYSSSFPSRRIDTDFSFSSRKKLVMKYSAPGSFYQPSEALDNLLILTELLRLCVTPVSPHAHPLLSCSHGPWKLSCLLGVSDCSARMMSKHNSLTPHVQCSLYWCNAELHSYMGRASSCCSSSSLTLVRSDPARCQQSYIGKDKEIFTQKTKDHFLTKALNVNSQGSRVI